MIKKLEVLFVRHGQSFGNLDKNLGPDTSLTEKGYKQASNLGTWLREKHYKINKIFCSPLNRAHQTAEIVNEYFGVEIVYDNDLIESNGEHLKEVPVRSHPFEVNSSLELGEIYEKFCYRVMQAMSRILKYNENGCVLIIAHAGTISSILRSILGVHTLMINTDQTGIHSLIWDGKRWIIQYLNNQEHLIENNKQ